jgi:hypothetical protein
VLARPARGGRAAAPPPGPRVRTDLLIRTDSAGGAKAFLHHVRALRSRGIHTFFSAGPPSPSRSAERSGPCPSTCRPPRGPAAAGHLTCQFVPAHPRVRNPENPARAPGLRHAHQQTGDRNRRPTATRPAQLGSAQLPKRNREVNALRAALPADTAAAPPTSPDRGWPLGQLRSCRWRLGERGVQSAVASRRPLQPTTATRSSRRDTAHDADHSAPWCPIAASSTAGIPAQPCTASTSSRS